MLPKDDQARDLAGECLAGECLAGDCVDRASPRAAFRRGMREALGVPLLVLASSFLGFGALVQAAGLSVWHGLFSSATAWALPGQIATLELYSLGSSLLVMTLSVALVNARLLPMTLVLMPVLRGPSTPRWAYYFAANWIAVTAWAAAMRDCPDMHPDERLPFFAGMSLTLWSATLVTTAVGFEMAGVVPLYVTLGLVFLNPIYFMLVFAADVRQPSWVLALLLGGVGGPLFYLATPDWSLLLTGAFAGSLAYAIERRRGRERAHD